MSSAASNGNHADVKRTVPHRQACAKKAAPQSQNPCDLLSSTPNSTKIDWSRQTQTSFKTFFDYIRWSRCEDRKRWMIEMSDQLDLMYFVTVTFPWEVSVKTAKKEIIKWTRRVRGYLVHSWVRVVEQKGGRPHVHMLVRLNGLLPDLERPQLRREVNYGKWKNGFGYCRVLRVRTVEGLAKYLVKAYAKRTVKRAMEFSRNIERRKYWQLSDEEKAALRNQTN